MYIIHVATVVLSPFFVYLFDSVYYGVCVSFCMDSVKSDVESTLVDVEVEYWCSSFSGIGGWYGSTILHAQLHKVELLRHYFQFQIIVQQYNKNNANILLQ